MMLLRSILVVLLGLSVTIFAETEPTSLVPNAMVFTSGAIITDHVHDDIPATDVFPEESQYTTYANWYEERLASGPGTMNILIDDDLIVGKWTGDAFDSLQPTVFIGVQGITQPNGMSNPSDNARNVWSEVRLQQRIFGDLIYLNSDANYSYLRYYQDISLITPINPAPLGFNLEGGNVSFNVKEETKLSVDTVNGRVGINVDNPEAALHVSGNIRYSGSFYGKLGEFYTYTNSSQVNNDNNDTTTVNVLSQTIEVPANNAAVVFGSLSISWGPSQSNGDGKITARISVNDGVDRKTSVDTYGDVEDWYNEACSTRHFFMYKNDSGTAVNITVGMEFGKISGEGSVIGSGRASISSNGANLAIAVIPHTN